MYINAEVSTQPMSVGIGIAESRPSGPDDQRAIVVTARKVLASISDLIDSNNDTKLEGRWENMTPKVLPFNPSPRSLEKLCLH